MYPNREVFPNSPLALVAAEVRFTDAARLRQQSTLDAISLALEGILPVQTQEDQTSLQLAEGQAPLIGQATVRTLRNASSTESLTISSRSLILETTEYSDFESFRAHLLTCVSALIQSHVTPAIQRIGLRYIDEIRVPSESSSATGGWGAWVDNHLVDHLNIGPKDAPVTSMQGIITYSLDHQRGLNFRFGALQGGAVVVPPSLVRSNFDQSLPLFVLDFDGYQEFPESTATLLDPDIVGEALDAVHGPAGETFQNVITEKAREFFREKRER